MTALSKQMSVGQIVAERPSRARIFEHLGIDYCCGGGRSLADACASSGLDPETVVRMLDASAEADTADDERSWSSESPGALIDHIESTHHMYLRRELPRLQGLLAKVAGVHGTDAPWIVAVKTVFEDLKEELESHMRKEEEVVFPFIRLLQEGRTSNNEANPIGGEFGDDPIQLMEDEHDEAGRALERIRSLSNDYTIPEWACGSFRATIDGLRALEKDMHQHVHKENNVLFPQARALAS